MSLQGPLIVVADQPATELVHTLSAAGAFPLVEANWADAPTAFVAVKPAAVVIVEPGPPKSESSARMLCLQIATASGPMVPVLALVQGDVEAAVPLALPIEAAAPSARVIARLRWAMRVRALHAAVLRRIGDFSAQGGKMPAMPSGDALDDATVLIAGRGPLYPALSIAVGERTNMVGGLSVEIAARHLTGRDINGIVVGDGFSPRMVEAFLTLLAEDARFHELPVAVIGDAPREFAEVLPNLHHASADPVRLVARLMPLVRLHSFELRLKRMLKSLDAGGMVDPLTGLLTRDYFFRELGKAVVEAGDRSQPLSVARLSFEGAPSERALLDRARIAARFIRVTDFATIENDGVLLVAFTQTDLRSAHVVARRIASGIRKALAAPGLTANITLATLKAGDTIDSLMVRVRGAKVVAAE